MFSICIALSKNRIGWLLFNTAGEDVLREFKREKFLRKEHNDNRKDIARRRVSLRINADKNNVLNCVFNSSESDNVPSTTMKPFEIRPGDELSLEANLRAINALKNAKEYSIDGEQDITQNIFEKLIIKDPAEFRNKTFMEHLQDLPYNETIFTKKLEEFFYTGLHLTFCRKRDDTLAIVSDRLRIK